ncbi:sensor histidine kinase [Thermodesulfobacteriota bacterium]
MDIWLDDLEQVGYIRATQGFKLEDVWGYTLAFKQALTQTIKEYNAEITSHRDLIDIDDMIFLHELIDYSNHLVSGCFIKRRDEIISRRREQLYEFQNFAARVVSVFDEEKIWSLAERAFSDIFGIGGVFIAQKKNRGWDDIKRIKIKISHQNLKELAEEVIGKNQFITINSSNNKHPLNASADEDHFKLICAPIQARPLSLNCIFCVHDRGQVFKFERFDRDLFRQFCYYTESVVSNCRMVAEVSQKRKDLRKLTRRLISIQEDERKRIASNIHDTLTQALTGIGYKALFCQELLEKDPGRLDSELESLVVNINETLRQSRQIISNLRPKILYDIGIEAALRKVLTDFGEDTSIQVNFRCSEPVEVYSEVGIALFRILQESLYNIKRHANSSRVEVILGTENHNLTLRIKDDGEGFDPFQKNRGLGLLTMRERAEELGGKLTINSSLKEGCQVIAAIPMKASQNAAPN